ncbi:MAG: tetratricopeptide repeat protein [Victivallaceae bacterium]|nr:tetratricopeptide repeat protein [Victivallaceae bacterium]
MSGKYIGKLKILILSGVISATALLTLSGCGKARALPTSALLDQAFQDAGRGEWEKALDNLEIITARDPDNCTALIFKAIACDGCGKADLALNAARRAAKNAPNDFRAQYTLGRLYAKDPQKMQDAITPLLRALQRRPDDGNTLLLLGRCAATLKLDSAVKYYRSLAANRHYRNCAELWNEMGLYYAERGQNRQAAACFVKAYKAAPSRPLIVLNFATFIDQYAGEQQRSLPFYKQYLRLAVPSPGSETRRKRVEARLEQLQANGINRP